MQGMMKKIFTVALLAIFCLTEAHAGDDGDLGLWANVEAQKKIVKGLSASVSGEIRTADAFNLMDRWSLEAGVSYRINKYLKTELDYVFIDQFNDWRLTDKGNVIHKYWSPRHRIMFSVTGQVKVKRVEFSLRERYQYTYRVGKNVDKYDADSREQIADEEISSKSKSVLRSRLQVAWNIKKSGFEPYAFYELYNNFNSGFAWDKMRFAVGTDYKISKKHSVGVFYYYIKSNDKDEENGNVLGVSYKIGL